MAKHDGHQCWNRHCTMTTASAIAFFRDRHSAALKALRQAALPTPNASESEVALFAASGLCTHEAVRVGIITSAALLFRCLQSEKAVVENPAPRDAHRRRQCGFLRNEDGSPDLCHLGTIRPDRIYPYSVDELAYVTLEMVNGRPFKASLSRVETAALFRIRVNDLDASPVPGKFRVHEGRSVRYRTDAVWTYYLEQVTDEDAA